MRYPLSIDLARSSPAPASTRTGLAVAALRGSGRNLADGAPATCPRPTLTACLGPHPIPRMPHSAADTPALLALWHGGDRSALATLVELHLPWLRSHLTERLGPFLRQQGDVEDYLQDAMLSFLRNAPRFQVRDAAQFRALLARVAENTLRDRNDWFRAKRRDLARNGSLPTESVLALDPKLAASATPSRHAAAAEDRDWVRLALELLDPEDRRILVAREYDNRSFVEIGEELAMTSSAVRMRWVRAVARLAAVMNDLRGGTIPAADPTADEP